LLLCRFSVICVATSGASTSKGDMRQRPTSRLFCWGDIGKSATTHFVFVLPLASKGSGRGEPSVATIWRRKPLRGFCSTASEATQVANKWQLKIMPPGRFKPSGSRSCGRLVLTCGMERRQEFSPLFWECLTGRDAGSRTSVPSWCSDWLKGTEDVVREIDEDLQHRRLHAGCCHGFTE